VSSMLLRELFDDTVRTFTPPFLGARRIIIGLYISGRQPVRVVGYGGTCGGFTSINQTVGSVKCRRRPCFHMPDRRNMASIQADSSLHP